MPKVFEREVVRKFRKYGDALEFVKKLRAETPRRYINPRIRLVGEEYVVTAVPVKTVARDGIKVITG